MRWFRFLLPSCPNKDGGKLHQMWRDAEHDATVYECDVCHEEWI